MQRWGILGTSFISETVAEQIIANPHSQLQAVAGRTRETLDAFADKFSVPDCYTDYQALIEDDSVDIVYIGLPNHIHHEYFIKALAASKHVLCEKSLSVDMDKSLAMRNAAKSSTQTVIEGLMYVHHPLTQALLELLESRRLGELKHIDAQYCVDIAQFVNAQGGGVIYDLGCYPFSSVHLIVQQMYGEKAADHAEIIAQGEVDKSTGNVVAATAELNFGSQLSASVKAAEHFDESPVLKIHTEQAVITLETNLWMPNSGENSFVIEYLEGEQKGSTEQVKISADGDAFYYQTQNLINMIDRQAHSQSLDLPYPSIDDSYRLMQWLTKWEALCKSNK